MNLTTKDRAIREARLNVERLQAWRRRYKLATGRWPDVLWHAWQRSVGLEFPLVGGKWPSRRILQATKEMKHKYGWPTTGWPESFGPFVRQLLGNP